MEENEIEPVVEIDDDGSLYILEEADEDPPEEEPPAQAPPPPPAYTTPANVEEPDFDPYDFAGNPKPHLDKARDEGARMAVEATYQMIAPLMGGLVSQIASEIIEEFKLPADAKFLIKDALSQTHPAMLGQFQTNKQARESLADLAYGKLARSGKIASRRESNDPEPTGPRRVRVEFADGIGAENIRRVEEMAGKKLTQSELKGMGLVK